jgi:transcriptional regulator with XRE-family HTH domain
MQQRRRGTYQVKRRARLADVMKAEGLPSIRALAERTGVHYSTLSLWSRGKVTPSDELREIFCQAFDGRYSEEWLFPRITTDTRKLGVPA